MLVYAGCVYWPFQWNPWIGIVVGSIILVGGVVDTAVKVVRSRGK